MAVVSLGTTASAIWANVCLRGRGKRAADHTRRGGRRHRCGPRPRQRSPPQWRQENLETDQHPLELGAQVEQATNDSAHNAVSHVVYKNPLKSCTSRPMSVSGPFFEAERRVTVSVDAALRHPFFGDGMAGAMDVLTAFEARNRCAHPSPFVVGCAVAAPAHTSPPRSKWAQAASVALYSLDDHQEDGRKVNHGAVSFIRNDYIARQLLARYAVSRGPAVPATVHCCLVLVRG